MKAKIVELRDAGEFYEVNNDQYLEFYDAYVAALTELGMYNNNQGEILWFGIKIPDGYKYVTKAEQTGKKPKCTMVFNHNLGIWEPVGGDTWFPKCHYIKPEPDKHTQNIEAAKKKILEAEKRLAEAKEELRKAQC